MHVEYLSPLPGLSSFFPDLFPRLTPWAKFFRPFRGLVKNSSARVGALGIVFARRVGA
jgi:hypothetical protein